MQFYGTSPVEIQRISAGPDVFAHNIEAVPRLCNTIRPQANFENSLSILNFVKNNSAILTKSGFMLGLGEKDNEVIQLLKDLKSASVDIVTIGQYLRPDKSCVPVEEFIRPEKFEYFKHKAIEIGIPFVSAGPFVRSSYRAEEAYKYMEEERCKLRFRN